MVGIDDLFAIPHIEEVVLSPDGTRLVATIAELADDEKSFVPALWEIDPFGERDTERLTHSKEGEHSPQFLLDGTVVFLSSHDSDVDNIWLLKSDEPIRLTDFPSGVDSFTVARESPVIAFMSPKFKTATTLDEDSSLASRREEAGIAAHLYEAAPVRDWNRWRGPREDTLWTAEVRDDAVHNVPLPARYDM